MKFLKKLFEGFSERKFNDNSSIDNTLETGFKHYLKKAFSGITSDGFNIYVEDQKKAFKWYRKKGFPEYDKTSFDSLTNLWDKAKISQENCDWDAAIAGAHHMLDGIAIFENKGNVSYESLLKYISVQQLLIILGNAHTAFADYKKAGLFLEVADNISENYIGSNETQTGLLLEKAVYLSLSKNKELYKMTMNRLMDKSTSNEEFAFNPSKWALFLFQKGMKNQQIWDENKKYIPRCQVHAIGYYNVSVDINKKRKDFQGLSMALFNIGLAHKTLGDKVNAEKNWNEARKSAKESNDTGLINHITNQIEKHK